MGYAIQNLDLDLDLERELLLITKLECMIIPNLGGWVADESVPQLVERVSG